MERDSDPVADDSPPARRDEAARLPDDRSRDMRDQTSSISTALEPDPPTAAAAEASRQSAVMIAPRTEPELDAGADVSVHEVPDQDASA